METQKLTITEPADWIEAAKKQAGAEGMNLSEWIGACILANLDQDVRRKMSPRRPAHRPSKNDVDTK